MTQKPRPKRKTALHRINFTLAHSVSAVQRSSPPFFPVSCFPWIFSGKPVRNPRPKPMPKPCLPILFFLPPRQNPCPMNPPPLFLSRPPWHKPRPPPVIGPDPWGPGLSYSGIIASFSSFRTALSHVSVMNPVHFKSVSPRFLPRLCLPQLPRPGQPQPGIRKPGTMDSPFA